MSILSTGLEKLEHLALAPTAVRTSNLDGTAVDLNDYEGDVVLILDVANGGTSTLDVKIQSSDTSGGSYGYRMSKSAANSAAVSLARDLAGDDVCVLILHPGYVRTEMTRHSGLIDADESARGLIARIDELGMEASGRFYHANGEELPW